MPDHGAQPIGSVAAGPGKALPVTMAEPDAHAAFKGKKDASGGLDGEVREKKPSAQREDAQAGERDAPVTARLKQKTKAGDLDDLISGGAYDKRSGGLSTESSNSFGNGSGGASNYRAAPAKPPASHQAQAPAEPKAPSTPPAQSTPAPRREMPAPTPVAKSATGGDALAERSQQFESNDGNGDRSPPKRRSRANEEPPPPPSAAAPAPAQSTTTSRGYANNMAADSKSAPPADPMPAATEEAKKEAQAGKDDVDVDRARAAQLAQNGRCDEATSIYARLDRSAPQRLNDSDRLSYAKCLRVLGRMAPAQEELNALRKNANQAGTVAPSTIEAEQKALKHAEHRQAQMNNAAGEPPPAKRATRASKKRPSAAAMDEAAPAETNVKKVYSY
jgi:hypothetical protein